MSKEIWTSFHPDLHIPVDLGMDDVSGWNRLFSFFADKEEVEQGMFTLWMLWTNRNNCLHNLTCGNPITMKSQIVAMATDYIPAASHPASGDQVTRGGWVPPMMETIKINVDAAFCSMSRVASLGVVARNKDAEFFLSAVTKVGDIESPLHGEIKAILFGEQMAKEMGFRNI